MPRAWTLHVAKAAVVLMEEAPFKTLSITAPSTTEQMHARRRRANKTRNGFLLLLAGVGFIASAAVWGAAVPAFLLGAPWNACRQGVFLGYLMGLLGGFVGLGMFAGVASRISVPRFGEFESGVTRESQALDFLAGREAMILFVLLPCALGAVFGSCLSEPPAPQVNGLPFNPIKAVGAIGGVLLTVPINWTVYKWWKQSDKAPLELPDSNPYRATP